MSTQRPPSTKASLSPSRQRLVQLMRFIGFGRIENLAVREGEPAFAVAPLVIRTVKVGGIGGVSAPRKTRRENYLLKSAVDELLDGLAQLGDGTVRRIEIAHGLPLFFEVEEVEPVI